MEMTIWDMMKSLISAIGGVFLAYTMLQNHFPYELRSPIKRYGSKFMKLFSPYISITFPEYQGDGFARSKAFTTIKRYLNANSSRQAKSLNANVVDDSQAIVFSMADNEEVSDEFRGIRIWWTSIYHVPNRQSISFFPREDEKRDFKLTFHKRHRDLVTQSYLKHVLEEGKAIAVKERHRKLFTNNSGDNLGWRSKNWTHVLFEHPARFDTLAVEPSKKEEILKDLITFSKAKNYYTKIGKPWKRGYLLYGPPGTGKSTMIAAMANLLKYDVYDLELTAVKDNTRLRKLLIDTTSKSIIVIEDIDCSLDLTGQREKKKDKEDEDKQDPVKEKKKEMEDNKSQVTLSGLLNVIDGLWSACGEERIIVFTTNYVEKLDPALIRRGRMDKRIELSYCCFGAFKIMAKNYLNVESSDHFEIIGRLLEETKTTPADVAENLLPKSEDEDAETCLVRLIEALEKEKEEARLKAEEEERVKSEKEKEKENETESNDKEISASEKKEKGGEEVSVSEGLENGGVKENGHA